MSQLSPDACPTYSEWVRYWTLDLGVTYLNHGAFGACPKVVLQEQQRLRSQLESEPMRFFMRELEPLADEARQMLAAFVHGSADDLAFVPNATAGVNTVLRSLRLGPGDELIVTTHEYNASRNALNFVAGQSGAQVVEVPLPFPISSSQTVLELVLGRVTAKTRLLLIDHVTSQTGLVLPVEALVSELNARGIDTLVDGAHGPGMLELDLERLGAAYYTGNCHKWMCCPKGAGFLYVRPDRQKEVRPLSISHGANSPRTDRSRFRVEFDWTGTDDPTAFLCVPAALRLMGGLLAGGWQELRSVNRELVLFGRKLLCEVLQIEPPAPEEMIGSLASVPLPLGSDSTLLPPFYLDALQQALFDRHLIEVPVIAWPSAPQRLLRISGQVYNHRSQYAQLARALGDELNRA